jgi:hypothetical protein
MNAIEQLQQVLGVTKDVPRVMIVVSVTAGNKVRLEANGLALVVDGAWTVGTRLIVRGGNVESAVSNSVLRCL